MKSPAPSEARTMALFASVSGATKMLAEVFSPVTSV